MASKTIYGCVDWVTGNVVFEGEACDGGDYTGCVIYSGVHANQVAVTINEVNCDDTYYACVNWAAGGRFELQIPDNCCIVLGDQCDHCDVDATPATVTVDIGDVSACSTCMATETQSTRWLQLPVSPAGTHILTQDPSDPCRWNLSSDSSGRRAYYNNDDCSDDYTEMNVEQIIFTVKRFKYYVWLSVYYSFEEGGGSDYTFVGTDYLFDNCVEAYIVNQRQSCEFAYATPYKDGYAFIN